MGLAVFLTVFTLAMLDSRASRSAPAIFPMPATLVQNELLILAKVPTGALSFHISESAAADFEAVDVTAPRPDDQPLASEDFADSVHDMEINGKMTGQRDIADHSIHDTKLAMNIGRLGTGGIAGPAEQEQNGRFWMLTVMALIFAAMTALTLCLWRHLRLSVAPQRTDRRV